MAMNIISKEKKEIKWIGLPTNSAQECQHIEVLETEPRVHTYVHVPVFDMLHVCVPHIKIVRRISN